MRQTTLLRYSGAEVNVAQSIPWFAVVSATAAIGLFADNMRLRHALDAAESSTVATTATPGTPRALPAAMTKRKRYAMRSNINAPVTEKQPVSDRSDDRIDEEVEARLEQAVEARLDTELEAIVAERVDARMEERHQQRRERHRAAMEEQVAAFAADRELAPETEEQMRAVMESAMNSIGETFQSMRDGDISREAMRDEVQAVRTDVANALEEVLGEDDAALFQEELRGPLGYRGPPR